MEVVVSSFLPLKLKGMDAPDWLVGMVLTTVPSILGMLTSPFYSVASDRTRTHMGRRIPYLLIMTPVVALLLVMIGYSDQVGLWLQSIRPASSALSALWLAAILVTFFSLFNGFMASSYFSLLNDVVPPEMITRFLAVFRIVGIAATSLFQYYFFGLARTHMAELIAGSGVLYGVMFMAMCLCVKEGAYPPAVQDAQVGGKWMNHARTYIKEGFGVKVYWYHFLAITFWNLNFAISSFRVFFAESVGLGLDEYGKLMGIAGVASALLLYPAGVLGDRWHPVRTMTLGVVMLIVVVPIQLVFVIFSIPASWGPALYMTLFVLHISVQAMVNASLLPLQMKLYPRDRFAQISSAAGIIQGVGAMSGGVLGGLWLDWLKGHETVPLYHYRYLPVWMSGSHIVCLVFMGLLYREWKRLGGDRDYVAP